MHSLRKRWEVRTLVPLLILGSAFPAAATEYVGETMLTVVAAQATRPIQPSTDDYDFLNFTAGLTWSVNGGSGGQICSNIGAALPRANPMMRAIALAAVSSGAAVIVTVDNSLPWVASYCQVTTLSIKSQ